MSRIDELIAAAREAAKNAEGEEKARQQARAEAFLEAKGEGYTKTDTEVGGIVKRNRDEAASDGSKWAELLGMDYEEAETLLNEMESGGLQSLLSGNEDNEDEGEGNVLSRVQAALEDRDSRIEDLSSSLADTNRRYAKDKVEVAFERAFDNARLDKTYLAPAKRLASYDDLVEKAAKGGEVSPDEIAERIESVKELSGVWFGGEGDSEGESDGRTLPGGFKIKEEAVSINIPATPAGRTSSDITDEDRAQRASSVY